MLDFDTAHHTNCSSKDFPIRGNRAEHALSAQMVPMAFAMGLATTHAENDSKSARNSLLVRVIKGSNVLNLRADIGGYVAHLPEEMARLDRSLVLSLAA